MHRDLSRLVRDVETLSRRLSSVERAANLRHSTIENGAVKIRDENGDLTATIGVQPDGSTTIDHVQGPPPPTPTTPTVTVDGAVLAVTWDGGFTGGAVAPKDFQGIDVHVSQTTENIDTPDAILGNLGTDRHNTATIMVDQKGPWHVALAARTLTGAASALTPLVTVEVTTGIVELEETLAQARQELDQAMADLQAALADLNNTDLPALRAALDELENVTLPALTADLADNDAAVANLHDNIIPALQTALAANEQAQSDLQDQQAALDGRLTTNEEVVDALQENIDSALVAINDPATGLNANATAAQQAQAAADAAREAADAALAGITSQVTNGSFETGDSTGWGSFPLGVTVVSDSSAADGTHLLRFVAADSSSNQTLTQVGPEAVAGRKWRVSAWVRRRDAVTEPAGYLRYNMAGRQTVGGAASWQFTKDLPASAIPGTWTQFTFDFEVPTTGNPGDRVVFWMTLANTIPDGVIVDVDLVELRDVTASSAALAAAQDALDRANEAHQLAGTADSNADAALIAASAAQSQAETTPRIYHATTVPTGTAPVNSTWWQHQGSLSGNVIGQWTQSASPSGSTWTKSLIGNETIANLDVGKLTAGAAVIVEAVAQKIAAAAGEFITINADQVTAGEIDTARLNAQSVAAAIGTFLSLSADQITSGTIATERLNAQQVAAAVGQFLTLNADQITSGKIATARLDAQSVAAAIGTFLTLQADQITALGAGFDQAIVNDLRARLFTVQKILANEVLIGGSYAVNADPWVRTYGTPSWPGETKTQFFDSANPWGSTAYALPDAAPADAAVLRSILDGNDQTLVVDYFEAKAGEQYRITYWMRSGGSRNAGAYSPYVQYWNGTGWAVWGEAPSPAYTYTAASPWVKVETGPINTNPLSQDRRLRLVWRHTTAAGTGQMLATGIAVERLVSANLIVDGTIVGRHLATNSVDTDALGANAITAKHTITGATVRTSASYPRTEMDNTGLYIYDEDGQQAVALRGDGDHVGLLGADGNTVGAIDENGNINGTGLNVAGDPVFMGAPLFGSAATQQNKQTGFTAFMEKQPWGLVANGWRTDMANRRIETSGGYMALMELQFAPRSGRTYNIVVEPIGVEVGSGTACNLEVRYANGVQPRVGSTQLFRWQVVNPITTSGQNIVFPLGGSFQYRQPVGTNQDDMRVLFVLWANGFVNIANQGYFRARIEDVGPNIGNTGIIRNDNTSSQVPVEPPAESTKKDYTKSYTPTSIRNWANGSVRTDGNRGSAMYQGSQGGNTWRSIALFPNMTGDLSGATINQMRVWMWFDHWYYSGGGTARLMLHGQTSLPASVPSMTLAKTVTGWPKPGGMWVDIPSQYWDGFKSGTYRGIGLGQASSNLTEYGYAPYNNRDRQMRIEVSYTK